MQKIKIAPSILSADFSKLADEIKAIERAGADLIHIDVMDGHFVNNITFGPVLIKSIRDVTELPFDVHLMINPAHNFIKEYLKPCGAVYGRHSNPNSHYLFKAISRNLRG